VAAPAAHNAPKEIGLHLFDVPGQHVLTTHTKPDAQVLPGPQSGAPAQGVEPGMQKPPPVEVVKHKQSVFVLLHCLNAPQLAPIHSGWGLLTPWAETGLTDPRIIGATYAIPPIASAFLIDSRRFVTVVPAPVGSTRFSVICTPIPGCSVLKPPAVYIRLPRKVKLWPTKQSMAAIEVAKARALRFWP
jgi:hypothetical protein